MKNHRLLALAATCLVLSTANAQTANPDSHPRMFAEIGYTALTAKTEFAGDQWKASPGLVTGSFGYQFHPNVAVEGVLGFGAGKDKVKFNGENTSEDVKLGTMYGVFVRPSVSLGDSFQLFGRLGWAHTELKSSEDGKDSDASLAYGIGASYHFNKSSYLQVNWTSYYDKHDTKIHGLGLAYGLRF
jgi:opacity protein-like surface antigen